MSKGKESPPLNPQSDNALFRAEVADAQAIKHDTIRPNTYRAKTPAKLAKSVSEAAFTNALLSDQQPDPIAGSEALAFRRDGIQHRLFSRLRNGDLAIEAELDLHGMTIAIARQNLAKFLQHCQQHDLRCVRIIHGKGWRSQNQQPVLKTQLNSWLQHYQDVLAFCSATITDGGTGAVYVLLRSQNKHHNTPS